MLFGNFYPVSYFQGFFHIKTDVNSIFDFVYVPHRGIAKFQLYQQRNVNWKLHKNCAFTKKDYRYKRTYCQDDETF